jgi:hypothetical protein
MGVMEIIKEILGERRVQFIIDLISIYFFYYKKIIFKLIKIYSGKRWRKIYIYKKI